MIRFLKQRLSIALRANGDGKWTAHLPGILSDYNSALITGTKIHRKDVNQGNYLSLLEQLYRSPEPSMRFNMAETFRYPSALSRYLRRYKVGDKVLLARRVDYDLRDRHYFEKPSVAGTFGAAVYTITACRTKLNSALFLCPVYSLSTKSNLFYESELSPALFDNKKRRRRQVASGQELGGAAARPIPSTARATETPRESRRRRGRSGGGGGVTR